MKQYILFDLDGTLTDPKVGITGCVQYALEALGIEEPDLDKLECFIGPPLQESFQTFYNMSEADAKKAVAKYRERFGETGIFENELYGGVHDLLRSLKAGGMHLAVASSKPTVYVERILKHFKIDKYFEVVVGSELDGTRTDKALVIQEVLHQFFPGKDVRYDEIYMVGDRMHDIKGAKTFRIESVGVTYGYGSMEELKEAKADYIVQSVAELKSFLMREVEEIRRKQAEANGTAPGSKAQKPNGIKLLWRMAIFFGLFYIVKLVATSILSNALQMLILQMPILQDYMFVKNDAGQITTFNANVSAILEAIGYVAGGLAIRKTAMQAIKKTMDEMSLSHLKKEPTKTYVLFAVAGIGAVVGMNVFLEMSGVAVMSDAYRAITEERFIPSLLLGLILYVVVIPVVEELVFRGIIYNCMRRFMKLNLAVILSAFVFSSFYSSTPSGMYAFAIGFVIAYAYEYSGSFYVSTAVRMGINLLMYLIAAMGLNQTAFVNWPVCLIALAALVVAIWQLEKEKGLLKTKVTVS